MKLALWCMAGCLAGCGLLGSGRDGDEAPLDEGEVFSETSYTLLGDTLLEKAGGFVVRYCSGDTLNIDTLDRFDSKIPFEMHSDSMLQFSLPEETLPSGAVRRRYEVLLRVGAGEGVIGLWNQIGIGYRVLSGEPTTEEIFAMDSVVDSYADSYSRSGLFYRFSKTMVTWFQKSDYGHLRAEAWTTPSEWFPTPPSELYDMEVRAVDSSTFEMKGLRSGETVQETRLPNGDMEYTSDVPGHQPHRHVRKPLSCPNPEVPDWYLPFLQANHSAPVDAVPSLEVR